MGKVLFIACTPVARYMMTEIMTNPQLAPVDICGVVNLGPAGAIGKANYDSYYDLSQRFSLPLHYCVNINDDETLNWIRDRQPDVIIQSGWSQKFGNELLSIPRYGCIGEHPAPLPRGRGAACVNWAILTGETDWGDSFFEMCEQYDAGSLYAQAFFDIELRDDVATVYDKVARASAGIVRDNIVNWTNGVFDRMQQDESKVTCYKRRRPEDGQFAFDMDTPQLYNFIRAQARPYPGAFFMDGDIKTTVWRARMTGLTSARPPGTLFEGDDTDGVLAVTGDQKVLELVRVQQQDRPEEWGRDWYRRTH